MGFLIGRLGLYNLNVGLMNRILGLYNLNGWLMNPIDAILLPFAGVKNPAFGVEIRSPGLFRVPLEVAPRIGTQPH